MQKRLDQAANRLASILFSTASEKVIFAESCTGGLVAAALAGVPGISNYHCGSVVVYRDSTKKTFLGISEEMLLEHTSVSAAVSDQLAIANLEKMTEATWSAAVTGHLGPGAPAELDGVIFVAVARRGKDSSPELKTCERFVLVGEARKARQFEAASIVLEQLFARIQDVTSSE